MPRLARSTSVTFALFGLLSVLTIDVLSSAGLKADTLFLSAAAAPSITLSSHLVGPNIAPESVRTTGGSIVADGRVSQRIIIAEKADYCTRACNARDFACRQARSLSHCAEQLRICQSSCRAR